MNRTCQVVLNDNKIPFWIRAVLCQYGYSCRETSHVKLRHGLLREQVLKVVSEHENGKEQLRQACRDYLLQADVEMMDRALACLFVIGSTEDIAAIEPLLHHFDEQIRKAARTCLFEIQRRPSEAE